MPLPTNSFFPATVFLPLKVNMTSVCSNPPAAQPTVPGLVVGHRVCPSQATQNSVMPPRGCTSSATTPLPKITQAETLFNNTHWNQKPSSFFCLFVFFILSFPLFFNPSSSLAASCGFCITKGFGWHLISCAFSLAHFQVPIQALICQVTDDQWSCWLTCFARVLPSGVRCTHYTCSHKDTSMQAGYR